MFAERKSVMKNLFSLYKTMQKLLSAENVLERTQTKEGSDIT
jgi:hypothetical protein